MEPPVVTTSSTSRARTPGPKGRPSTRRSVPRPLGCLRTTNQALSATTATPWANWSAPMVSPPTASKAAPSSSAVATRASQARRRSAPRARARFTSTKWRLRSPDASSTGSSKVVSPCRRTTSSRAARQSAAESDMVGGR
jgi:hypothetical protein